MAEWKEVVENGQIFYIHDQYGNIVKTSDNSYVALMPKVIKLGPFKSLDEAQMCLITQRNDLNMLLEEFNNKVVKK